jgi:hypothetical protein
MYLPRRVGKGDTSQVENNGIVATEHVTSVSGPVARLPLGNDLLVTAAQVVGFLEWNYWGHCAAIVVAHL